MNVLQSLRSTKNTDPIIGQILRLLSLLTEAKKEIVFIWVPSHVGIQGNELADVAANEAAKLPFTDHPVLHHDLRRFLHQRLRELWNQQWTHHPPTKLCTVRQNVFEKFFKIPRRSDQVIITRLRIGHSSISQGHLMSNSPPAKCPYCTSQATIRHILSECTALQIFRDRMNISTTFQDNFKDITSTNATLTFIDAINLRHLL